MLVLTLITAGLACLLPSGRRLSERIKAGAAAGRAFPPAARFLPRPAASEAATGYQVQPHQPSVCSFVPSFIYVSQPGVVTAEAGQGGPHKDELRREF